MGAANKLTLSAAYSPTIGATAGRAATTYLDMAIRNGSRAFSEAQERADKEEADSKAHAAEKLLSLAEKRPLTEEDYRLAGLIDRKAVREGLEDRQKLEATIKHWENIDRNNDPILQSALNREEAKFNIANGLTANGGSIARGRSSGSHSNSKNKGWSMNYDSAKKMYADMGLDSGDAQRMSVLRQEYANAGKDPSIVDRYVQQKGKGGFLFGDVDMPNTGDYLGIWGTDTNKLKRELNRFAAESNMGPNVYQ